MLHLSLQYKKLLAERDAKITEMHAQVTTLEKKNADLGETPGQPCLNPNCAVLLTAWQASERRMICLPYTHAYWVQAAAWHSMRWPCCCLEFHTAALTIHNSPKCTLIQHALHAVSRPAVEIHRGAAGNPAGSYSKSQG